MAPWMRALGWRLVPRTMSSGALLVSIASATFAFAQANGGGELTQTNFVTDPADWEETERGIPVTDPLTIRHCGTCHAADEDGNLSRISWIRTTPEGWAQTIRRMVRLHGAPVGPEDARAVIRYLATRHGLAPEEAEPVMYMAERRLITETNIPNEDVRQACASCHAFGQALTSRRSRTEWALLQNLHVALFPQAEAQYRPAAEGHGGPDAGPLVPTRRDVALEWLSENAGLQTPEWSAWAPRIGTPQLPGKWMVSAHLPGKGLYVGEMTVAAGATPDRFTTQTALRSVATGETLSRAGEGILYTGFSWRGTSEGAAAGDTPDAPAAQLREALLFAPGQDSAQGRWYWGENHEFGFDVSLTRATGGPAIAAVTPGGAKVGSEGTELRIFGSDLPADLAPADIDLGQGVAVRRIVSAGPTEAVIAIDVAEDALVGQRDVLIGGARLERALPIYPKIDYLKVTPDRAISRLGGIAYGKQYQQFDALAFSNGPDGEPDTEDDFEIGPIDVTWSVEEFLTTNYDDDVDFVGTLDADGLFTPATEGPNPERQFSRNNYGDIWVVATATKETDQHGDPLTGRGYLVVTVPTWQRWDQPEVSQ